MWHSIARGGGSPPGGLLPCGYCSVWVDAMCTHATCRGNVMRSHQSYQEAFQVILTMYC
jgi:hypothetical protein